MNHTTNANGNEPDRSEVLSAYARWAPVYDMVFKMPLYWGQRAAARHVNSLGGHVLEAGVGTGMSIPLYEDHVKVTGIDLSEEMLRKARKRAAGKSNIHSLQEMDAAALNFPDNHFDVAVAIYVITVVPDPVGAIRELERVTKPGGTVILVNHFSKQSGLWGVAEKCLKPFEKELGWDPEFQKARLINQTGLSLETEETLPPLDLFTLLKFRKSNANTSQIQS